MSNRNSIINKTKPSNRLPFENNWVQTVKPNVPRVKSFFALGRGQKHKTWCFSQVKHRTDLKNISEAMNFDDGDSYTHFCYTVCQVFEKMHFFKKIIDVFCLTIFFCVFLRQNAVWRHRFFDVFLWPSDGPLKIVWFKPSEKISWFKPWNRTPFENNLVQTVKPHAVQTKFGPNRRNNNVVQSANRLPFEYLSLTLVEGILVISSIKVTENLVFNPGGR